MNRRGCEQEGESTTVSEGTPRDAEESFGVDATHGLEKSQQRNKRAPSHSPSVGSAPLTRRKRLASLIHQHSKRQVRGGMGWQIWDAMSARSIAIGT